MEVGWTCGVHEGKQMDSKMNRWQVRNGKRSRGSLRRRLHDDIKHWQWANWSRKAKDRQQWRELAEGYFQ